MKIKGCGNVRRPCGLELVDLQGGKSPMGAEGNLDICMTNMEGDLEEVGPEGNWEALEEREVEVGSEGLSSAIKEPGKPNMSVDFEVLLRDSDTTRAQPPDDAMMVDGDLNAHMDANTPLLCHHHHPDASQTHGGVNGHTSMATSNGGNSLINEENCNHGTSTLVVSSSDPQLREDSNVIMGCPAELGNQHATGAEILSDSQGKIIHVDNQQAKNQQEDCTSVGGLALWVKWRGKWQAGIQCSMQDCPAATMKAMPTYSRKTYLLVYFPSTRSFVWADAQLVCPIAESPEPLAFGSYESGRDSVSDFNSARRYLLRRITAAMLDISDCLPLQAVVESSRDVSVWKEFAKEAAQAVKYSELGFMLVKLSGTILSTYIRESWLDNRFEEWKKQCETTETAGLLEKLIKELRNAVCWDEVGKIWDESEQPNLDSEWKTWKEDAKRDSPSGSKSHCDSTPTTSFHGGFTANKKLGSYSWDDKHAWSLDVVDSSSEPSRKCLKLDIQCGDPIEKVLHESHNTTKKCFTEEKGICDPELFNLTEMTNTRGGSELQHSKVVMAQNSLTPIIADSIEKTISPQKLKASGGRVQCSAFSARKGRQCNRYSSDGSMYCWKHGPSHSTEMQKKTSYIPMRSVACGLDSLICIGMTKYGRRCTHKSKDGTSFCRKHLLQGADKACEGPAVGHNSLGQSSAAVNSCRMEPKVETRETQNVNSEKLVGGSNRKKKPDLSFSGHDAIVRESSGHGKLVNRTGQRATNWRRCVGWCRGSGGQCSHRAKPGFSHCEKHLPGSFGYGGKEQERYVSKEVFQAGLARNVTHEEESDLLRARDLLHEYMKACLPGNTGRDGQWSQQKVRDWILLEASDNIKTAEALYNLVSAEKDSLEKVLSKENMERTEQFSGAIVPYEPKAICYTVPSVQRSGDVGIEQPLPCADQIKPVSTSCNGHIQRFKCKLCPQEFIELAVLSQHWRACHRRAAQQLFRGYACQNCSSPFTNKKGLERHWNAHHPDTPFRSNSLLVALCIICSGQFADFEDLWQHVMYSHPNSLGLVIPAAKLGFKQESVGISSEQPSIGLEVAEIIKCSQCDYTFVTYSDLHQHEEVSHKQSLHPAESSHVECMGRLVTSDSDYKFKCKICGLRFRLLPDLGRHHQAEHKPVQAMRWKTVKEEGIGTSLSQEPHFNISIDREHKRLQKLDVRRASHNLQENIETKISQSQHQICPKELYDPSVAEIESYSGPKVQVCPGNKDILAVAKFSCCKNKLFSILGKKYAILPEHLAIKAAKLCSEANVRLQWHREGYVCLNGCGDYIPLRQATFGTSFPSASFVPLQYTATCGDVAIDYKDRSQGGDIVLDESHLVLTTAEIKSKCVVLCEDISFGQEMVAIPCVISQDAMEPCNCPLCIGNRNISLVESHRPWANFSYVTKRLLDPSLGLDTKSSQLGCMCQESHCSPETCDHVHLFDNDNKDALDIFGQPMRGRFPYNYQGRIILEEGYLVYECNSICGCQEHCQNRVLQKGVRVKLEVYKTRHKGWAVRAAQPIARGTFVCEYIGEVLDDQEANKRGERYDQEGCSYLYDIDAHIDTDFHVRTKPFVIDATNYGNVARFINHSCSPNLVNYQVLVESMDCQLAHIGLYASRNIKVGEELAYDYRYKLLPGKGCPCHCGSKNCRGRLY